MNSLFAKLGGRKFALTLLVVMSSSLLPIVYARMGVSQEITLTVLGVLAGSVGMFGIANVVSAKQAAKSEKKDE